MGTATIAPGELARGPATKARRLSFTQERLWFLGRLEPASTALHVPLVLRLRGPLARPALQRAVTRVARRHPALRMAIGENHGRPFAVYRDPAAVAIDVPIVQAKLAAHGATNDDVEAYLRQQAHHLSRPPFDLASDPLLRARLFRLADDDHGLVMVVHHLAVDGWSLRVLVRDLVAFYEAATERRQAKLPAVIPFPVVAHQQRKRHREGGFDKDIAYWVAALAGLRPAPLPPDDTIPDPGPPIAARVEAILGPDRLADLRRLAREERATEFMVLLAALMVLLVRATGETDVAVGAPIAGRTAPGLEDCVGPLINTLVVRADLGGNPTFREALRRVRRSALAAYDHQTVPFERVQAALGAAGGRPAAAPFSAFLNMVALPAYPATIGGATLERLPVDPEHALFDLSLYARPRAGALTLSLVYPASRFHPDTAAAAMTHLQAIFDAVAANPDVRLAAVALPPTAPRRDVRPRPAPGFRPVPPEDVESSVGDRFARQAARTPDAVAVRDDGVAWTYAELARAASDVARTLDNAIGRAADRSPGRVALVMSHGRAALAALLGILGRGSAVVPLDPLAPPARLRALFRDADVDCVVTDDGHADLVDGLGPPIVPVGNAVPTAGPAGFSGAAPEAIAYLLYTSGSTGVPKAVVQSHRHVLGHHRVYANALRIGPGDRLSLLAGLHFDMGIQDALAGLLTGAAVCAYDLRSRGADGLLPWLIDEGVTVYHSTPTVFRAMAGRPGAAAGALPSLRVAKLGGEAAARGDVETVRRIGGSGCVFVGALGMTESTNALQFFADRETPLPRALAPAGFPVDGVDIALLDPDGNTLAGHGVGEIVIRGPHLALGYWRRDDLTAAAFAPGTTDDPRPAYRTGDIGRTLPNGAIELLGRRDDQVKIRGHRLELGEIEAVLRQAPGVGEAAAAARSDAAGESRLLAWVAPPADAAELPDAAAVRAFLRTRLPPVLQPNTVVVTAGLPKTATGKIDRRALPDPPEESPGNGRGLGSPLEATVLAVWEELFGGDVGIDDDFFGLGGHSLMAPRLVALLAEATGVAVPVRAVFEAPTVAALAAHIDRLRTEGSASAPPPPPSLQSSIVLHPNGAGPPVFVVPGGKGDGARLYRFAAIGRILADRPFYGFPGDEETTMVVGGSWAEESAASGADQIRQLRNGGPAVLVGSCVGGLLAWAIAARLEAEGDPVGRLLMIDTRRPVTGTGARHRVADGRSARLRKLKAIDPRPLRTPVTLFVNETWGQDDPVLGWGAFIGPGFTAIPIPGGHGELLRTQPEAFARLLRAALDEPSHPGGG
jgi:amino acid adenylation domain-containing protein